MRRPIGRLDGKGPGGTARAAARLVVLAPPAPPGGNVMRGVVDRGPTGESIDMPFVTVTVCIPGTDNCSTVDHVLLDTASVGLRVMASALKLGSDLPPMLNSALLPLGTCGHFVSGYTWGSVKRADVKLGEGMAAGLAIQVISDTDAPYATIPIECRSTGFNQGTPSALGANGIMGVSMFTQDCSTPCTTSISPRMYFACTATGCKGTTLELDSQIANPVTLLAGNNNGVGLTFPLVPTGGASTLVGTLTFGIGTQANNQLNGAHVYRTDSQGNFTTTYKGSDLKASFIDSGSNGLFFNDSTIPVCGDYYCPSLPLALSAVNTAADGSTVSVSFTIENILGVTSNVAAFYAGGPFGFSTKFDWGTPFFFGRRVFQALQNANTPYGAGPYWAY